MIHVTTHRDLAGDIEDVCDAEADRIAQAVAAIRRSYDRAFRRYTGQRAARFTQADRRGATREVADIPFYVSPQYEKTSRPLAGGDLPMIAVTRDLSSRGVGFRCDMPLSGGQLIADFDAQAQGRIRFLLEVRWRRRESLHSYLVGARIVQLVEFQ